MNKTQQNNENSLTVDNNPIDSEFVNAVFLKWLPLLGIPFILFLGGTIIWKGLSELGLSHLFVDTLKSNVTLYTVSLILLLNSYIFSAYLTLFFLSFVSIDKEKKSVKRKRSFIVLTVFIILFTVTYIAVWHLAEWPGVKLFFLISYLLMFPCYIYRSIRNRYPNQLRFAKQTGLNLNLILIILSMFAIFTVVQTFIPKHHQFVLRIASFNQTPRQSAWYALDKSYIEKFDLNYKSTNNVDVTKSSLEHLKQTFAANELTANYHERVHNHLYKVQQNALYGYFLWNFGEIRVFCPSSFHIETETTNKRIINTNCLTIKEEYLQPLPMTY